MIFISHLIKVYIGSLRCIRVRKCHSKSTRPYAILCASFTCMITWMGFDTFNECARWCVTYDSGQSNLVVPIIKVNTLFRQWFHLWSCSNILRQMWVGMSPTGQRWDVHCTTWNIQKAFTTSLLLPCKWAQSSCEMYSCKSNISCKSYVLLLTWVVPMQAYNEGSHCGHQ